MNVKYAGLAVLAIILVIGIGGWLVSYTPPEEVLANDEPNIVAHIGELVDFHNGYIIFTGTNKFDIGSSFRPHTALIWRLGYGDRYEIRFYHGDTICLGDTAYLVMMNQGEYLLYKVGD